MKTFITTILLLTISVFVYAQDYYRDTTIERAVFNEVNRHRESLGIPKVAFNSDNILAVPFGEKLVKENLASVDDEWIIYHCRCSAGSEIIAMRGLGNLDGGAMYTSADKIAKFLVKGWNDSPAHKRGMENKDVTRGFNSVHIFKDKKLGSYVVLSVFQFLRDKSYYVNFNWSENEKYPRGYLDNRN